MKLTKREALNRLRAHQLGGDWFYLDDESCSFHNGMTGYSFSISTPRLLRAFSSAGLLRQWDDKQQGMKRRTP